MKKHIGIYLGSFNPVHLGHLFVATAVLNETNLDQIWMVLSPQNPEKDFVEASEVDRFEMLRLALGGSTRIVASDVELHLPKPSFTINTVHYLKKKYPDCVFSLIIGEDHVTSFDGWKSSEELFLFFESIYVYPRKKPSNHGGVDARFTFLKVPEIEISSTYIRTLILQQKMVCFFLPDTVYNYIKAKGLYGSKPQ